MLHEFIVVRTIAQEDRYTVLLGQIGDRVVPDLLVGVVALGVGDHQHHIVFGVEQSLQCAVSPGLVPEHDDPHGRCPPWREVRRGPELPDDVLGSR
jgi:hypothetical protein